MDFDSTITEESTLIQIYMRLPESVFRKAITISDEDYYRYESGIITECYAKLRRILKKSNSWDECLKQITIEIIKHSNNIKEIEIKGMNLIEDCLKQLNIGGLKRAASQIKTRKGFVSFSNKFNKIDTYVISFNWSNHLIKLVCPKVQFGNIISNRLKFKNSRCLGFDKTFTILTPKDKLDQFQKLKIGKNIFCGDSLSDLLPCLYSDIAFAFSSHDKEFLAVCNTIREKFGRSIFVVNDFEEANRILNETKLIF